KTSAHRCEINRRSNGCFVHPAKFFQPAKKCFASSMRKGPLQYRFSWAGRLSNDHYVAHDCAARDGRRLHARATTALQHLSNLAFELDLCMRHYHQRRKIEKIDKSKLSKMLRTMQVTIGK